MHYLKKARIYGFALNYLLLSLHRKCKLIILPIPFNFLLMENDYRQRQRKSYTVMRTIYDLTMAILFLAIGLTMLLGDKFGIPALRDFVAGLNPFIRYSFGGICILYGSFRLYRGIKHDY